MMILFVRHGESVDDIEDRYGGWADFDLTEKGKEQLVASAKKIASMDEKFEIVLSSPLKRAIQAAEIIARQIDVKVEIFEYLKERNLNGILTGMVRSEAMKKFPEQVTKHQNHEYVDGSERAEDMNARVKTAVGLLLKMKYKSLIAVTHGLFLRTFFKSMMNIDVRRVGDGGFVLIEEKVNNFEILQAEGIEYE
jgi:2,3-bisphosphoglycerate-dependent phosphoglycerate mutase